MDSLIRMELIYHKRLFLVDLEDLKKIHNVYVWVICEL